MQPVDPYHQLERTGTVCLRSAELTPRAQAFLFEGMLDRLATIGRDHVGDAGMSASCVTTRM